MDILLFMLLGGLLAMQSLSDRWPRVVMTIIVIGYSAVLIIDYQYHIYVGKIEQDEIAIFIQQHHQQQNTRYESQWLIDATEDYLSAQKNGEAFSGSFYQYLNDKNKQL